MYIAKKQAINKMPDPRLFVSYCWSSTEHEEWVLRLGTELRENGVDVILDKWDLKEGNDGLEIYKNLSITS